MIDDKNDFDVANIATPSDKVQLPWPRAKCTENLMKFGRVVSEICVQYSVHTDRGTDRQTVLLSSSA